MAVVGIKPLPNRSGGWDQFWRRTYRVPWRVECNDRDDGPVAIRLATTGSPPVPWLARIGAYYRLSASEFDTGSYLIGYDYECERADAQTNTSTWIATANYGAYDTGTFGEDPVAWPLRVSFGQQKFEKLSANDAVSGNPILNSAGDPFDEPVTGDDTRTLITVARNEAIGGLTPFDFTKASAFRDTVNSSPWNGFAPKTVKCDSITTGDPTYDSNARIYYYEVTYQFTANVALNPNDQTVMGWRKAILDQGYQKIAGGQVIPILNGGQQVDDPVLLDGMGGVLAVGGTPVYLVFDQYVPLDWSTLNIDFTIALGVA